MVYKIRLNDLERRVKFNDHDLIVFEKNICSLSKLYGKYLLRGYLEGMRLMNIQRYKIVETKTYYDLYVPVSPKHLIDWLCVKVGFVSYKDIGESCNICGLSGEDCMRERHFNTYVVLNDEIRLEV